MTKSSLTLDDLLAGGSTHHRYAPRQRYYEWWGDTLLRLEVERVLRDEQPLFAVSDLHGVADRDAINLLGASFPYPDQPLALIPTPTERLLYDWQARHIVWRGVTQGTLEWNAKSRADAFLRDDNLCIRYADGTVHAITTDGSRDIVYGQAVHRDEFGITKGTFFAPDGQRLAFYRMDQTAVADYPQLSLAGDIATCQPDKYPMAGQASHTVSVGVYDLQSREVVYLDTPTTTAYLTNIAFSPDGHLIYMYELPRSQRQTDLVEYDALTGERRRVLCTERDACYVEPQHPVAFLPWDDQRFVAWSRRDGYWHLYLHSLATGAAERQLTSGPWEVQQLVGFDRQRHEIVIAANRPSPLVTALYAVGADGIRPLSSEQGIHTATLSATGSQIVDAYSTPDIAQAYTLLGAKPTPLFADRDSWHGHPQPLWRTGTLSAADGTTPLHWRMALPHDFDATRRYPVVVYVYGGPHVQLVNEGWHHGARPWDTYMAERGYIVFTLDGRGSDGRGRDFEQATYRQLGQVEMRDQMQGVAFLRTLPYVDTTRLGVHGWSFGGFMAISLMVNYPDTFRVGVAGGPVIDWRWYEVMYGERYMQRPQDNPDGYRRTSLIHKAAALRGRLQIIIGANDPVCVPQHTLRFIEACNDAGTSPDLYIYPGEPHNIKGCRAVHLYERITRYFDDYL